MTRSRSRFRLLPRTVAAAALPVFLLASTASAIAQIPTPSPENEPEQRDLELFYDHGSARRLTAGSQNVWSVHISQTLRPSGPYQADSVESSMDLELTESVEATGNGSFRIVLEVTDVEAAGFQAAEEQEAAQGRRIDLVYEEGRLQIPVDERSVGFFGSLHEMRMADIALRSHVLAPALPAEPDEGEQFDLRGQVPTGWTPFSHHVSGTATVRASGRENGVDVVEIATELRAEAQIALPAIDNPEATVLGEEEAELNDFFLATMFNVLVPDGTDPRSLLPDFPIQVGDAHIHDHAHRRRPQGSRRRLRRLLAAGSLILLMGACASHPQYARAATSVNLEGPLHLQQQAMLHPGSGVLVALTAQGSAELSGTTIQPNPEAREDLGDAVWALTDKDVALEARWTIDQQLTSALPYGPDKQAGVAGSGLPGWQLAAGLALAALLGIGLLAGIRYRNRSTARSESEDQPGDAVTGKRGRTNRVSRWP